MSLHLTYDEHPVSTDAILRLLPIFYLELSARLKKGAEAYGDASFSADPENLLHEMRQEVLDLAGWGFVLWTRLDKLERRLRGTNGGQKT